jgi:hypothetical protein
LAEKQILAYNVVRTIFGGCECIGNLQNYLKVLQSFGWMKIIVMGSFWGHTIWITIEEYDEALDRFYNALVKRVEASGNTLMIWIEVRE